MFRSWKTIYFQGLKQILRGIDRLTAESFAPMSLTMFEKWGKIIAISLGYFDTIQNWAP